MYRIFNKTAAYDIIIQIYMVQSLLYRLWLNDSVYCVVKAKSTIVIHKVNRGKKPKIVISEMWVSNNMTLEIERIVRKKRGIQICWLSNTTHAFNTFKVNFRFHIGFQDCSLMETEAEAMPILYLISHACFRTGCIQSPYYRPILSRLSSLSPIASFTPIFW